MATQASHLHSDGCWRFIREGQLYNYFCIASYPAMIYRGDWAEGNPKEYVGGNKR